MTEDREKLQSSLESILTNVEKQKVKMLISQEESLINKLFIVPRV